MKNKKNKKLYVVISVIIITILSIFIILALKGIYGSSSKQINKGYNFLHDLQKVNAINKGQSIHIKDFQEVKRISDFSNVKYTLVNNNYVTELDEEYNVVGFFEQSVNKIYNVDELTEEECIEYANKYLNSIYKDDIVFKEIKDKESNENPFYTISFYKMHNNYICYSSEVLVKINKYDGSLCGYSNYSTNNGEFLSDINISEEESKDIFSNYMKELGFEGEIIGKPKVGYVNIDGEANQICYLILYRITEKDNTVKFSDVIINADTGEIIKHSNNIMELLPDENSSN
ncbi:Uncharacterised protein [uncultured Clostridium sp.]|uniref:PepSY domain-containing protein n=1 Tax=uncultured Clostridium sp. TaxID=59620 RepID=UPI00082286FD|nr:PepSY domain-containing protein [uncultured Clostridium sp.]SCK03841.1 Uncharacterised protein [uncultured Clostridium sp.]